MNPLTTATLRATASICLLAIAGNVAADDQDEAMLQACPTLKAWVEHKKELAAQQPPATAPQSVVLPKLRPKLLEWGKLDQDVRQPMMTPGAMANPAKAKAAIQRMMAVDELSYRRIKSVIDEYGFPTISMVGGDGSGAAFLLVQHQVGHPEFQQFILDIMGPLAKRGEASQEQYALLLDRVLVEGQHKPQRYGTQFKQVDGVLKMNPIEDPEHLDSRRAELRMMPIAAYRCVLEHVYNVPVK